MEEFYQKELEEFKALSPELQEKIKKDKDLMDEEVMDEKCFDMFLEHDVNKDGNLDFEEYKAFRASANSLRKKLYGIDSVEDEQELRKRFDLFR